jgi:hypothetical protein
VTVTTETDAPQVEDVAGSHSKACWSVQEVGWKDLVPGLSDEVIALVAPPVVVCAQDLGHRPAD